MCVLFFLLFLAGSYLGAQDTPAAAENPTPKTIRELAKGGSESIPRLEPLLKSPDLEVRIEAVKAITEIGTQHSLDPLVQATADSDPEVQIRATDGLVNFYLPGYVHSGFGASLRRVGTGIKSKFTDTNDQVIESYVEVRPQVIQALGRLVRGGSSMEARANAARAVGILRGRAAVPDLIEALHSKDSAVMYESLIALQKIRDQSAARSIGFVMRDLDQRVQIAAIETVGLLQNKDALPELLDVLNHARNSKVQKAALTSMAMLPDEKSREMYARYLRSKDDRLRAAAAEGFARLKNPEDQPMLETAFQNEKKTSPRLSLAFALASLGQTGIAELSPLQILIDTLNSKSYRGEAFALLVELARTPDVRSALYRSMEHGTKDEKIQLARVLARSGDAGSVPELEKVSRDPDAEVAQEGLRAIRSVKARLQL